MTSKRSTEGNMYIYESATVIDINTANVYHALNGFSAGSILAGITHQAGSTGAITDTEDNGGTLRCTDVGHGLSTGAYITQTGMGDAAQNGVTRVTVISVDIYYCDDIAYNSIDDTGTWYQGSYLEVDNGNSGRFVISWSMSAFVAVANKTFKFELVKNTTDLDEFAAERKFGSTDLGVLAGSGLVDLVEGDRLWMQAKNISDTTNFTIKHANIGIHSI